MRHLLATIAVLALVLAFGGATTAQVASPEPTASPPPVPLEVEPVTKPLPVADYWGQWSLHKEASTGRLDQATSNARNAADRKRARFYRDASAVNKDELAWLSNHQPRECYAIEYEVWRAATKDLHRIHRKAARFAKAGDKPGLRRTLKQQKAAVRLRNTAHSAFSDCPDLSVPAIQRSTASPIVGRWVTTKDYVDGDGRHFILRIHSEVSPNGNLLARDKQGIGCEGLGLGIVPVTMRGRGEFFTERGLRPLSGSPGFRWDSAKVHCYPRGGRQPKLLTSGAAGTYWYDGSADIVYEANGNCFWRKKTGSPKDCKAFWRGTPAGLGKKAVQSGVDDPEQIFGLVSGRYRMEWRTRNCEQVDILVSQLDGDFNYAKSSRSSYATTTINDLPQGTYEIQQLDPDCDDWTVRVDWMRS